MIEERRRRGEYAFTGGKGLLDSSGGGIKVGLVGKTYFRPYRGDDARGDSGVGVGRVVESKFGPMGRDVNGGGGRGNGDLEEIFLELVDKVGRGCHELTTLFK